MADLNSRRKIVFYIVFATIGLVYSIRIFSLQVLNQSYEQRAISNALNKITIYPARSIIYDRNGELLVYNGVIYDLIVFPDQVKSLDTSQLCQLLDISKSDFIKRMELAKSKYKKRGKNNAYTRSAPFITNLSTAQYTKLQENLFQFPGFYIEPKTDRLYAYKGAAHVLGYLGEASEKLVSSNTYYKNGDLTGITGIEKAYEEYIRGKKGVRTVWQDSKYSERGSVEGGKFDSAAVAGPDVYSTIDLDLQKMAESMLENKRGSIVAIEPATGEVLVLANKPDYNPDLLVGETRAKAFRQLLVDPKKPLYNRAIRGTYPPGSTFKTVIALAARQEGVLEPGTMHGCAGGYHIGSLRVGCHPHPSPLNLAGSLGISCNAYYCQVYRDILDNPAIGNVRIGYKHLEDHIKSFGLGSPIGIDIPGEASGNVPSPEYLDKRHGKKWKSSTTISLAIGQGEILLTPLQMAHMACVIANRGFYIIPHTIKAIGPQKFIPQKYKEKHWCSIDTVYFQSVIDGMELVPKPGGTAWGTGVKDIVICAKTGTAQNPHGEDHSLYIAFAPKYNPKIAVAVIVEHGGWGATWAAPMANLLIERYINGKEKESSAPHLLDRMLKGVVN